ncbi:MAG: ATP-binding protein [Acidobacteriota bacterium]
MSDPSPSPGSSGPWFADPWRLGLLAAAASAGAFLPMGMAAAAVATLAVAWCLLGLRTVAERGVAVAFVLAATAGAAWIVSNAWTEIDVDTWSDEVAVAYGAVWGELETAALRTAESFSAPVTGASEPLDGATRLRLFEALSAQAEGSNVTLLLLDGNGEAVAWHGPGLLHEPAGYELPDDGRTWRSGVTASTLMAVGPVPGTDPPWRVVAGQSYVADPFPFSPRRTESPIGWTLRAAGLPGDGDLAPAPRGDGGSRTIDAAVPGEASGHHGWGPPPTLHVAVGDGPLVTAGGVDFAPWFHGLLATALGFAGLALFGSVNAFSRGGAAADRSAWIPPRAVAGLLTAAAMALGGLATGVSGPSIGWAVAGAALLGLVTSPFFPRPSGPFAGALLAAIGVVAYVALSRWVQGTTGPMDGAATLLPLAPGAWWLVGPPLTVVALFLATAGRRSAPVEDGRNHDRWAWGAAALALLAAAAVDHPAPAVPMLAAAAAAAATWWRRLWSPRLGHRATLLLLASLVAAAGWQIANRQVFRGHLGDGVLPLLSPPTVDESNEMLIHLHGFFDGVDLGPWLNPAGRTQDSASPTDPTRGAPQSGATASGAAESGVEVLDPAGILDPADVRYPVDLRDPAGLGYGSDPEDRSDVRDLAFALWRSSPLTQLDSLSALVLEGQRGELSSFSFGLALGDLDLAGRNPARWPLPSAEAWRDALVQGVAPVTLDGRPWGIVRFWLMPRPGFRIAADETDELEANLVRGKPRRGAADGLPEPVRYGLFDLRGRAVWSPWNEAPPLDPEVLEEARRSASERGQVARGRTRTPDGPSWFWLSRGVDGYEALFLRILGPRGGVEQAGAQALGSLVVLALMAAVALAFSLGRGTAKSWMSSILRSYSRRLILVYTSLLLLPMVALNLVLLRATGEQRRAEQLADAEGAIVSARSFLTDYLLGLDPGFSMETQVNRELLEWISSLVQHQVNVYWGSRLWASSQEELFTSGLLPPRIPGEVYTRLALLGYDTGFRTQRTGDLDYLEVYAPLDVAGIASSQQGLFLSVPLLEREEEVETELAILRRRAWLVTAALFLLLAAAGGRLTRSFTEPLMELIEGTRRIARGQPFGALRPRDTELSHLAEAIDVMARRVEESRRRLLLEKQFVERVVDNITAGVVSLDQQGRILVQNRVAAQLLGTEVGTPIEGAESRTEGLEPVWEFLVSARRGRKAVTEAIKLRPVGGRVDVFEWSVIWVPIPGDEGPTELLVVEDVTEEMRGQRLEAWAEMARIIAHEIKNPLTPIQLSAEHLRQVFRVDPDRAGEVLERCVDSILRNVEELRQIASDFSTYSRIPVAELRPGDLLDLVGELVEGYRVAGESGVRVSLVAGEGIRNADGSAPKVEFDAKLLSRAVRNLLENARRAAMPDGTVEVTVSADSRNAAVEVADSGPGVDPQSLERIFEPYFSTYSTGTGLGLAITRRIVGEHRGTIEARNRTSGGFAVKITIPRVAPAPSAFAQIPSN